MKPTHLKTLSARIDEIHFLLSVDRITTFRAYDLIFNYNDFLKRPLTLSQFVPCDENGTPFLMEFELPNQARYNKIKQAYNKAQQNVIFEGFKCDYFGNGAQKISGHHDVLYTFCANAVYYKDETLKTLSDLAAATIKNPLKLK